MIAVMIGFIIGLAIFASGTLIGYAVGYHDGSGEKTAGECKTENRKA